MYNPKIDKRIAMIAQDTMTSKNLQKNLSMSFVCGNAAGELHGEYTIEKQCHEHLIEINHVPQTQSSDGRAMTNDA